MDWNIDTDRDETSNSELTRRERDFIANGNLGKYSKSDIPEINKRIEQKASKLPQRIELLIKDILLLHSHNELERGYEPLIPTDISTDFTGRRYATRYCDVPNPNLRRENEHAIKFGLELGSALRLIFEANDSTEEYTNFLYGLILSDIENSSGSTDEREEQLDELLHEFRQMYVSHVEDSFYQKPVGERLVQRDQKARLQAKRALIDVGIDPYESLVDAVIRQAKSNDKNTVGDKQMERAVCKNIDRIRLADHLRNSIRKDTEYINEKPLKGVDADELINDLWQKTDMTLLKNNEGSKQSRKIRIANVSNEFNVSSSKATESLRILKNHYNKGTGPRFEITKEVGDGEWQLNGYGKVLAVYAFELESSIWMYESILPDVSPITRHGLRPIWRFPAEAVAQMLSENIEENYNTLCGYSIESLINKYKSELRELVRSN